MTFNRYSFPPSSLKNIYLLSQDGFKVTLDLAQIGYPTNYAVLVEVGRKSEDYKFSHVFGKIHVPHPDLNLEDKINRYQQWQKLGCSRIQ